MDYYELYRKNGQNQHAKKYTASTFYIESLLQNILRL